ncbi:hypothetical protein [Nannocystis sp. SCPEA4]|uniref:hypothetical protein n=1 Tax=Nannocystis sp. SCPEA4 TaxID=2996787 RepID=UPI00226E8756|nr:hypothetical protein [Nannocystis sp. SCPEA4]MCY1054408.1 hypothetical protein [Nannocystis sp. SCPEA4]
MLGLRFSRLVHAAIASGALVLAACGNGGKGGTDTDTDTDATSASDTDDPTSPTFDPNPFPPDPTDPLPPPDPPPPDPPPPADVPPALLGAKFLDPSTLQLSFTEPLAPVDTVNPKRFRLSVAQGYYGNYGGQPSTFLADPMFYNYTTYCPPSPPCYYEPPYNYYYCYYGPYCYNQNTGPIEPVAVLPLEGDPTSIVLPLGVPIQPSLCSTLEALEDPNFKRVLHLHYAAGGLSQITDLSGLALPSLGDAWVKYDGDFYSYEGPAFSTLSPFLPIPCDLFDLP